MASSLPRALVLFTMLVATGPALEAAPVWLKDIPDAFQHQKWGAKTDPKPPAPLKAIIGAADPDGDVLMLVNHPGGQRTILAWELSGSWNPPFARNSDFFGRAMAVGSFNGWCNFATYTDQLYHFKQKEINGIGDVADADDLHKEVRTLARDYAGVYSGTSAFTKDLNKVFANRNVDPTRTRDGLTAQSYKQDGNDVKFRSSSVSVGEKKLPKSTLFEHMRTAIDKFGDTVSLRLIYEGTPGANDPQSALWWRGPAVDNQGKDTGAFHLVAVAGYDTAGNGTIYFADPDSNPTGGGATGNKDADAGWSEAKLGKVDATGSDNWLAAAGVGLPVKQRRFAAGAAVPKPVGAEPTAAEQDRLYFEGTLAASKTELAIAAAGYKRYDTVKIKYIETLEVVKAGKKPQVPGLTGALTFQISPGQPSSGPHAISGRIDEAFLFPGLSAERITSVINLRVNGATVPSMIVANPNDLNPGVWNVYFYGPGSTDRWGNPIAAGGVSLRAGSGVAALTGLDLLEFDYATVAGGELTAWDFFYNDSTDATLRSLGVQVLGGGYDLPMFQTPPLLQADGDGDGAPDVVDNCPGIPNDQVDFDADGIGDACDASTVPALSSSGVAALLALLLLALTW